VAPWYAGGAGSPERAAVPPSRIDRRGQAPHNRLMWKPRKPHVGDDYVTGSFRDGILMIVVILTAITIIWLAYGWALGVPGAPAAP